MPNPPLSPAEIEKANSVDLVGLIQNETAQKGVNKGADTFFVCPFHKDRTPSLSVSHDKPLYHCFACGAKGNVIDFIENYHTTTFVEAVNYLNGKQTIQEKFVPKVATRVIKEVKPKEIANSALLETFLNKLVAYIQPEDWDRVGTYLQNRAIDLSDFDLGVSEHPTLYPIPKMNYEAFTGTRKALEAMFNKQEIIEHGLFAESGFSQYMSYDFFFIYYGEAQDGKYTITNLQARRIKPKEGEIRECFLRGKQVLPFNLHLLSELPYKSTIFLVESPIDAVSLNKIIKAGGFDSYTGNNPYVVSTGGSQIKSDRIIEICQERKHTVHLCMDNDEAGDKANQNWLIKLANSGIKASIPKLIPPRFKDANEYLIAYKDMFCGEG